MRKKLDTSFYQEMTLYTHMLLRKKR